MERNPLLIFPQPKRVDRTKLDSNPVGEKHTPSKARQIERIEPRLSPLFAVLEAKNAFLNKYISGMEPEMVLVIEYIGSIDNFFNAVRKIEALKYLTEFEEDFEPDDDFYDIKYPDKALLGQIFLVMANLTALEEILTLWENYKNDTWARTDSGRIKNGMGKFRDLFECLNDIRPYSPKDRLRDTGFETYVEELVEGGNQVVKFEVELFFDTSSICRKNSRDQLEKILEAHGGRLVPGSETIIDSIRYHGIIAEAPISAFQDLSQVEQIEILQFERIMFVRPLGQVSVKAHYENSPYAEMQESEQVLLEQSSPVVALLDGNPMANHCLLQDRLIVDDPDEFGAKYQPSEQIHGTMMASLIVHGDLESTEESPLKRPVYVRPIMCPDANDYNQPRSETVPTDRLPIDLIHRAVIRMFTHNGSDGAIAPTIKIINLSIGDPSRPFHNYLSAWAKLLDFLSYKYNILFIVSAGNFVSEIEIFKNHDVFQELSDHEKQKIIFASIRDTNIQARKIISPAESINAITVGSAYIDEYSRAVINPQRILFDGADQVAPFSRIGHGFKKSTKPDILHAGGRLSYRRSPIGHQDGTTILNPITNTLPAAGPGQSVAVPGREGNLKTMAFSFGTSNSAALTTRLGAQLYEVLEEINNEREPDERIPESYYHVLIKALLVHSAKWGEAKKPFEQLVREDHSVSNQATKDHIRRFLGNGKIDPARILYCTESRVTLLGFGELGKEEGQQFALPLPDVFNQDALRKQLTLTLGWMTPLNFESNRYRKAALFFENLTKSDKRVDLPIDMSRVNSGYKSSKRGTVQHDILEGDRIEQFVDGTNLILNISCKGDASGFRKGEMIKYGLAVTLESLEENLVPIYHEIKNRIEIQVEQRIKL
jgi:hypothetical protein